MIVVADWDRLWQVVYDREVRKGSSPNAAVFDADEHMINRWGPRPPEPKETRQ